MNIFTVAMTVMAFVLAIVAVMTIDTFVSMRKLRKHAEERRRKVEENEKRLDEVEAENEYARSLLAELEELKKGGK